MFHFIYDQFSVTVLAARLFLYRPNKTLKVKTLPITIIEIGRINISPMQIEQPTATQNI